MRILMKHLTSILAGLCISPFSHAAEQAPIPTGHHRLAGASNYLLYNSCKPLENPKAIITLTTEMNAGARGFAFQFNANSLATEQNPHGANADGTPSSMGWQQYIINVRAGKEKNTTDVSGFLEPWPSSKQDESNGSDLINRGGYHLVTLADTPTPTLPAGTKLEILLNTAPHDYSVTGITFEATLPGGAKTIVLYPKSDYWNGKTIELEGLALDQTLCLGNAKHPYNDKRFCPDVKKGARHLKKMDLTPVSTFQLNFAGPWFNKGEGTIQYEASGGTHLVPVLPDEKLNAQSRAHLPYCSAGADTAETSNIHYSTLPVTGGRQTFTLAPRCENGTRAYFFNCDYDSFCATPENAKTCLGGGWCYPVDVSNVKAQGRRQCQNVPRADERDPQGSWLDKVVYPGSPSDERTGGAH
jgi:hypothetical protein